MCNFCENLQVGNKIILNGRNLSVKDNIYKAVITNKEDYVKDLFHFSLKGMKSQDGNVYVMMEYLLKLKNNALNQEIIMNPFSESVQFNFYPMCGLRLSKEIIEFENSRKMYINNKN